MRKQLVFQQEKNSNPQSQAQNDHDERQGADNAPGTGVLQRPVSLSDSGLLAVFPQPVQSFFYFNPASIDNSVLLS